MLTFRSSKIIYYGPHACENCGALIAKMGHIFGSTAFTYPDGPIYPNTEWHPHVCDQDQVFRYKGECAKRYVLSAHPGVVARQDMEHKDWRIFYTNSETLLTPGMTGRMMMEWDAWLNAFYVLVNDHTADPRQCRSEARPDLPPTELAR